jgi:hypothetical protein
VRLGADLPRPSRRSDDGQMISSRLYDWTRYALLIRPFRYRQENLNFWPYWSGIPASRLPAQYQACVAFDRFLCRGSRW